MMQANLSAMAPVLLALYYSILGVLALYGVHRLLLVAVYLRTRHNRPATPPEPEVWPVVTVQLPLYNEMYVARRLIDAVCALDYPPGQLEIQVLDDSTDETTEVVAERVAYYRERGLDIHHLHRTDRSGFKAGALEAGTAVARGEFLAVFDADFVPRQNFLVDSVPFLVADSELGMVQARWTHINRGYSLLTQVQAIMLDGHFVVEHTARHRGGCFFNFNGTAGIWRRQAIEDAGGWQHDTLTEDLDLSYRSQLAGWRFLYLPDLTAPSELPVDVNGFKSQQHRWARGSVQTGRKLLGRLLRAKLPFKVKLEAFIHLTNNGAYPLMMVLSLLVFPAMILRRGSSMKLLLMVDLPLFISATVSVLIFYAVSQLGAGDESGETGRHNLRFLPALMGLGIGLAVNNTPAVVGGLFKRGGVFERTPKYAIAQRGQSWVKKRYRSRLGLSVWIEGLLALYFLVCMVYAFKVGMWLSLPFLYLFLQGYSYMFLLSVVPALRRAAKQSQPKTQSMEVERGQT